MLTDLKSNNVLVISFSKVSWLVIAQLKRSLSWVVITVVQGDDRHDIKDIHLVAVSLQTQLSQGLPNFRLG
jgi:hypothetical protein